MVTFGEQLRRWRTDQGISLAKIADALGCSVVYVSDIERNRRNPPARQKIARILEVLGKDDELTHMLRLASEARKTIQFDIEGTTTEVKDMLVAMARCADEGKLNRRLAREIRELLAKQGGTE